jgi:putative glutamine amidotransferase
MKPSYRPQVVTHEGTGLNIVKVIMEHLDADLIVIDRLKDACTVPFTHVLLLGGCDISPHLYEEPLRHARPCNDERDRIEWVLAKRALTRNAPIMGICRGHQMLTVVAGGKLYQDMAKDGASWDHDWSPVHPLTRITGPLKTYLPTWNVNSYHHQAVKTVPAGFKVLAKSKDGIIESIWRPGALGVQFHPELLFPGNAHWIGLFKWFIKGLA